MSGSPFVVVNMTALERREVSLVPEKYYFENILDFKKVLKIDGIIGDIWHGVLEKRLNFTTVISPSVDGEYGSRDENHT